MDNNLIKSSERVRLYGEVFTPDWMVEKMLDTPGIKEACQDLEATFLEPAAGDGNFLVAILERKLDLVKREYSKNLRQFENFALYATSTLYGIELLEDNAQKCAINMASYFQRVYYDMARALDGQIKKAVIKSANHIISKNIVNGDFLKREDRAGQPIIFVDWQALTRLDRRTVNIRVQPTEYSLDDIYNKKDNKEGLIYEYADQDEQIDIFSLLEEKDEEARPEKVKYRYKACSISDVHKEVMEVYD